MPRLADLDRPLLILGAHWREPARQTRTPRPLPTPPEGAAWWTADEAAAALRTSRSRVFVLLRQGALMRVKGAPGRKTMVTRASVEAYRDRLSTTPVRDTPPKRRTRHGAFPVQEPVPNPYEMAEALRASRRALLRN